MSRAERAAVGAATAIFGAVLYAYAGFSFTRAAGLHDRPPVAPSRVEPGAGPVAVAGRAQSLGRDRVATSPLGRAGCVHFDYTKNRRSGKNRLVERKRLSFPFLVVDDAGGAVLVDPADASHLYGQLTRREDAFSEDEQTVAEGDPVVVHGRPVAPPSGSPARAALQRDAGLLVVSAAGVDPAVESLAGRCIGTGVLGALVLALAAWFLVPVFRPPRV